MHPALVTMINTMNTAIATARAAKVPVNEILYAIKSVYRGYTVPK